MTSAARLKLVNPNPELRAALYLRYSSDIQNDRSIERQAADLEKVAPRLNLKLDPRFYYEDRAESATSLFDRPGLTRRLLGDAEKGLFDVVLVEHTDRLARNKADTFWLAQQFKFHNIKIFTPAGEVDDLRLTFEAYQNEADIEKIRFRVRSGHDDKTRLGLIMNAPPFGYDNVLGRPGEKVKDPDQAKTVERIFREFVAGKSPRKIACDLTSDGILSPSGGAWTFQTINKIIQNEIYVGVYSRNKLHRIKNPNTGKRITRPASPDDLITVDVPHLRIIDTTLWNAAQAVRRERANKTFGNKQVERATVTRRLHPFAGLFRCADCGGKMIICGSVRKGDRAIVCSAAWWRSTCSHRKSYSLARLTKLATDRMHAHLTNPEFVNERAKERAKELARMEREANTERDTTQRELDRVDLRIKKLIRLTEDDESEDVPQEARDRLKALRIEQRGLQQRLVILDASGQGATLLPTAIKALARDVDTLHQMLQDNPDDPACRLALGNLIDRVLVHPTGLHQPYDVSLLARHAAYVGDLPLFPEFQKKKTQENQSICPVNAAVPS
jgi:site-specific DNA recombinase